MGRVLVKRLVIRSEVQLLFYEGIVIDTILFRSYANQSQNVINRRWFFLFLMLVPNT